MVPSTPSSPAASPAAIISPTTAFATPAPPPVSDYPSSEAQLLPPVSDLRKSIAPDVGSQTPTKPQNDPAVENTAVSGRGKETLPPVAPQEAQSKGKLDNSKPSEDNPSHNSLRNGSPSESYRNESNAMMDTGAPITHTLMVSQPSELPLSLGDQPVAKGPGDSLIIGTSTYTPGSPAQIPDVVISLGNGHIVANGISYAISNSLTTNIPLIASQAIHIDSSGGLIVARTTLALGSVTTIDGHVISASGAYLMIECSHAISRPTVAPQVLTFANGVIVSAGASAVTVSGTTYYMLSSGDGIMINGLTKAIPTAPPPSIFTISGQAFTADPIGYTIGSQSIALDEMAITLAGTLVSLGPSGLQIASKIIPLTPNQESDSAGLVGVILSGFGNGPGAGFANGSSTTAFWVLEVGRKD